MRKNDSLLVCEAETWMLEEDNSPRNKEIQSRMLYYGSECELAYWQSRFGLLDDEANEYQRIRETALHLALKEYAVLKPKGFAMIDDYYFHGKITFTKLGKLHGISRQAAAKALRKHVSNLRPLVEAHIEKLIADAAT